MHMPQKHLKIIIIWFMVMLSSDYCRLEMEVHIWIYLFDKIVGRSRWDWSNPFSLGQIAPSRFMPVDPYLDSRIDRSFLASKFSMHVSSTRNIGLTSEHFDTIVKSYFFQYKSSDDFMRSCIFICFLHPD